MTRAEAVVVEPDIPIADETVHVDHAQEAEAEGFTFTREDGTVEHARTREEVLAVCPVMGKLAIDAPEKANLLLDMAAAGSQQLAAEAEEKAKTPARENNKTPELFKQNTETRATQSSDKAQTVKPVEKSADTTFEAAQNQIEHSQAFEPVGIVAETTSTRDDIVATSDFVTVAETEAARESGPSSDVNPTLVRLDPKNTDSEPTRSRHESSSQPLYPESSTTAASKREPMPVLEEKTPSTLAEKVDKSNIIALESLSADTETTEPLPDESAGVVLDYFDTGDKNSAQESGSAYNNDIGGPTGTDEAIETWDDTADKSMNPQDKASLINQFIGHDEALLTDVQLVGYGGYEEQYTDFPELEAKSEIEYDAVEVYADLAHLIAMQDDLETERDELITGPLTQMDAEEQLPFEQDNSAESTVDNRFTEYIQEVYVSEVEDEPLNIESLREVADEQPPEDTLACLAKIIENANEEYVVPERLAQVLDDIDELLQEHYSVTDEEQGVTKKRAQLELTLELTEKLLQLFQELGYSQPDEALRELVRRFGHNFLLEAFEHIYKLRHEGQRREFLPSVPSVATPGAQVSPLRQRVGKLIFTVIARSFPKGATS